MKFIARFFVLLVIALTLPLLGQEPKKDVAKKAVTKKAPQPSEVGKYGETPPAEILQAKGLVRDQGRYILQKQEYDVLAKLDSAQPYFAEFFSALASYDEMMVNENAIVQLNQQKINIEYNMINLKNQMSEMQNQINTLKVQEKKKVVLPNLAVLQAQYQQMNLEYKKIDSSLNETNRELRLRKTQKVTPKKQDQILANLIQLYAAHLDRFTELREVVDSLTKEYQIVSGDKTVQKAVTDLNQANKTSLRISPSDRFLIATKDFRFTTKKIGD